MDSWLWWLIAGVLLTVGELFTGTFVLLMFAGGAFAATVAAALGAPVALQVVVFTLGSALGLLAVRPLRERTRGRADEGTEALAGFEGADAVVLEAVDEHGGQVKIRGEIWRARPLDHTQVFEAGERVRVVEIRGATAMVWRD
jgi:membrane protein implicated in regulation of membrane protease activity